MTKERDYLQIDLDTYVQTFKRYPIVFESAKGSRIWDINGKEYIDALAGIAVNNIGHCHPNLVKAIQDQAEKLTHISNFFISKPQALLSEKLTSIANMPRVFLTNSGAESVEGAIKFARKYAHDHGRGGTVISMKNCFHGRTLATIATGKKSMQDGFEPIPQGFMQVPFNDFDAIKQVANQDVAAIILEPIQGEGGINVADIDFLRKVRSFCDAENIVLIFDEIQCGMGRTGHWFAKDYFHVQPDIMTLAKGLGGGVPIGAVLVNDKVHQSIEFGSHGTTFGGNPLVCRAALAVIETIEDENILKNVIEKGSWFKQEILNQNVRGIKEIRGLGLMIGIEFSFETKPLVQKMLDNGVIANATANNVLRLVPPLNIRKEELEIVISVIKESVEAIQK